MSFACGGYPEADGLSALLPHLPATFSITQSKQQQYNNT